ncbi:hypothetical protein PTQ19_07220 [Microbacterium esteraromaticum]|uniref:hypothetical protein n=1 Tax=Microbacterium esteraromaticum TaxID=57043 RepID=UPI0023684604|nr:hypothetical protein [Microbacterium esteraromaticum]WDH80214.1 hypothetical protein PTQ19_07220 [Microbacterium esteraromaticum]
MTEGVLVTIITAGQAIILALIGLLGVRLGKVKRDVSAARWQVENTHDTNMREENDSRHAETKRWIDDLSDNFTDQIKTLAKDLGGMRAEIRGDRETHRALADRVTHLERKKDS